MGKAVLLVLTNPVVGQEQEYNDWYDNIHLREVCALPGFTGARRYRLADGEYPQKYMALYDIAADDPKKALASLSEAAGSGTFNMSPALDMKTISMGLFEQITDYQK
jgi:hypothetical protein